MEDFLFIKKAAEGGILLDLLLGRTQFRSLGRLFGKMTRPREIADFQVFIMTFLVVIFEITVFKLLFRRLSAKEV
ncbi:hypothetical protein ACFO8Q_10620 [Effusibacillus consociatus]|uniref:Uncharacterized protein n=1 Tax=Effusibacillus consociatus TaxID=1117041 RepID=A0ABV9Q0V7_9BACL